MSTPNPELEALREEVRALRTRVERPTRRWGVIIAALVLSSSLALADLIQFTPNSPAIASDVNANFQQLKTWLEAKTGSVLSAGITTPTLTVGTAGGVTLTTNGSGQLVASGGVALADNTGITSNRFNVTTPLSQFPTATTFSAGALEASISDNGGTMVLMVSVTGYCTTPGPTMINILVDGVTQERMRLYCDRINSHMAFPPAFVRLNRNALSTPPPTTRTVRLQPLTCNASNPCNAGLVSSFVDGNDFGTVTVLRLPTP